MRISVVQMIGVALGVLGMGAIPVWAYEESQVKQGGTIRGQVTLDGGMPKAMAFNLVTIPDPVFVGEFQPEQDGALLKISYLDLRAR